MQKLMNEKIIPKIMAFVNLKGIQAIKDGMVYSMPLLIVGSVFLIITNFPIQAVVDILEQTGIKAVLEQANGATFNISAMIAVLGISYNYIKLEGQEPLKWCNRSPWSIYYDDTCFHYHRKWRYSRGDHQ